jgi:branched-chain amino acid transport system substrate-binding protein
MRTPWVLKSIAAALLVVMLQPGAAIAQHADMPGVTSQEIKIGQTMPYSGPASAYGAWGQAIAAYFAMVNDNGGVRGRKINLISLDDGYSPPKTVEQTRKLVESDNVAFLFASFGTPTSAAVQRYLNTKHIPQLFVASGAARWNDPKSFPWSTPGFPSFQAEARMFARYILRKNPNARIGVLYPNDDAGKDYLAGFRAGLGDKAGSMIVRESSYESTDPTIESQIIALKGAGADTFVSFASPKFAAQAIRKIDDLGWKPLRLINSPSSNIGAVLRPAGLERSTGIVTAQFIKDPNNARWKDDPGMQKWIAWMKRYNAKADMNDVYNVYGYYMGEIMKDILEACGDDLSRQNILDKALALKGVHPDMLLPGIEVNTSPSDYDPIKEVRLQQFDGKDWQIIEAGPEK